MVIMQWPGSPDNKSCLTSFAPEYAHAPTDKLNTHTHTHMSSHSLHSAPYCAGRGYESLCAVLAHCAPQNSPLTHVASIHHKLKEREFERQCQAERNRARKMETQLNEGSNDKKKLWETKRKKKQQRREKILFFHQWFPPLQHFTTCMFPCIDL